MVVRIVRIVGAVGGTAAGRYALAGGANPSVLNRFSVNCGCCPFLSTRCPTCARALPPARHVSGGRSVAGLACTPSGSAPGGADRQSVALRAEPSAVRAQAVLAAEMIQADVLPGAGIKPGAARRLDPNLAGDGRRAAFEPQRQSRRIVQRRSRPLAGTAIRSTPTTHLFDFAHCPTPITAPPPTVDHPKHKRLPDSCSLASVLRRHPPPQASRRAAVEQRTQSQQPCPSGQA